MPPTNATYQKANIYVKHSNDAGIYLYTQVNGAKLPIILRNALIRGRAKWGDSPAMTRIIFGEMVQSDVLNLNDFAIGCEVTDNDYLLLAVDDKKKVVAIASEDGQIFKKIPFEQYCTMSDESLMWRHLTDGYGPGEDRMILDPNKKVRFNL